ncbi:probable receptor-like protein kinase At1g11050 [Rhodamnia argentea]|uniref:non-specific serine/threonine protein kinase n=1 Tax=Rhodamnia argentea TaxID=178133 RepID=A0A8B8NEQ7_9MYRT|nr:probable receptor-like protein kinase At1g11050 [Rhodamnia argentea]
MERHSSRKPRFGSWKQHVCGQGYSNRGRRSQGRRSSITAPPPSTLRKFQSFFSSDVRVSDPTGVSLLWPNAHCAGEEMEARGRVLQLCLFGFTALLVRSTLSDPFPAPSPDQACPLSSFQYKPGVECIGVPEKTTYWGSYPTTLCCGNVLKALSQSLALHASNTSDIFLDGGQWSDCSEHLLQPLSPPANSCRFDNLFDGRSQCSSFSLSFIDRQEPYRAAQRNCSNFNPSFDDVCKDCISAIVTARDSILSLLQANDNDTERAICGVAVITSLASGKVGNSSAMEDFYRCLPALDKPDPGYIKVKSSTVKVVVAVLIAAIGLTLVISLVKHVTGNNKPPTPAQLKEMKTWSGLYRFSRAEIENAINYRNEKKCLGRGSAGQVYKGVLPSGQVVAIKHIYKSNTSDSFRREVEGLSRVRHPNLVCLFGYCNEGGEQYLVYEYCPAGNLASHLLRKDTVLTWERRVKILRECALGLRYLHHYIDGCIVHRDIKLTNILLTENMEPKLSDFGLARILNMEESKVFTDVRGTIGYMDPEYMSNAKLTCASDIYSFGIVALQLLSGQKVIDLDLEARDQLTRKARDVSMGKRPLEDFEDPRLNGNINKADFESILQVAVFCVAKDSKDRPTIDMFFDELEKAWKNTVAEVSSDILQPLV